MASKQHEQWKRDLFDHLDRKLSGRISCEFGENRDSHSPANRVRHREPSHRSSGRASRCTLTATIYCEAPVS